MALFAKGTSFSGAADNTSDVFADVADNTIIKKDSFNTIAQQSYSVANPAFTGPVWSSGPTDTNAYTIAETITVGFTSATHYAVTSSQGAGTVGFGSTGSAFSDVTTGVSWTLAADAHYASGDRIKLAVQSMGPNVTLKNGTTLFTLSQITTVTLANPIATVDDGKRLKFTSMTAYQHVINCAPNGSGSRLTFGGSIGDSCELFAYQGIWYVWDKVNVTAS